MLHGGSALLQATSQVQPAAAHSAPGRGKGRSGGAQRRRPLIIVPISSQAYAAGNPTTHSTDTVLPVITGDLISTVMCTSRGVPSLKAQKPEPLACCMCSGRHHTANVILAFLWVDFPLRHTLPSTALLQPLCCHDRKPTHGVAFDHHSKSNSCTYSIRPCSYGVILL